MSRKNLLVNDFYIEVQNLLLVSIFVSGDKLCHCGIVGVFKFSAIENVQTAFAGTEMLPEMIELHFIAVVLAVIGMYSV